MKKKVKLDIDVEALNFIKKVSKLSGCSRDTVINVILAMEIIKTEILRGKEKSKK